MTRLPHFSRMLTAVALVVLFGFTLVHGADSPIDLIAQADLAFTTRYVEDDMTHAIALYEAVLPSLDTLSPDSQAYVLNRLAQLCYEAAMFSDGETAEDGVLYEKGKAFGFQSLRLNPQFTEFERRSFTEAVSVVTDVAALHWAASNWGKLCGMNPFVGIFSQGEVLALFSRAVEVDPLYWGASASSSLGSLLVMSPALMGGDKDKGLALIEDSIAADPSYLSNRVILAEYWGFTYNYFGQLDGVRDADLIQRELAIVLDAEIGDWPFWNRIAKQQAETLLERLRNMTD
jgi:hypothetical protein